MLAGCRRILVVGSGGAGKSTLARDLGELLQLPVIHLDRHYWRPGWQPMSQEEWVHLVQELAGRDEWIMDGNYGGTLPTRMARCDAVVFLDYSRVTCLVGVFKRRMMGRVYPDMAAGCPERIDWQFLSWIWSYGRRSRPRVMDALKSVTHEVGVVVLKRRKDALRLLDELRRARGA